MHTPVDLHTLVTLDSGSPQEHPGSAAGSAWGLLWQNGGLRVGGGGGGGETRAGGGGDTSVGGGGDTTVGGGGETRAGGGGEPPGKHRW